MILLHRSIVEWSSTTHRYFPQLMPNCKSYNIKKMESDPLHVLRWDLLTKENYPTITGRRSRRSSADIKRDASKKQEGLTAEHEADPIPFPLYRKICNWSITEGNIYVWCWTILQWTCVGRASSIDPLGFHNFSLGVSDSIKVLYDKSKADNKGKR